MDTFGERLKDMFRAKIDDSFVEKVVESIMEKVRNKSDSLVPAASIRGQHKIEILTCFVLSSRFFNPISAEGAKN